MNPQPSDLTACSYVLGSYSETAPDVWQLTPEQGLEIGGAILLVWAIAWGFRMVTRVINLDEGRNEDA